jgi:hypothetical protein
VLYPATDAGKRALAERDLQTCEEQGKESVGLNAGKSKVARQAGSAAVIGAAATGAASIFRAPGELAANTLAGGALGGVGSLVKSALEANHPDRVYEEFVKKCMKRRGHEVLGWR